MIENQNCSYREIFEVEVTSNLQTELFYAARDLPGSDRHWTASKDVSLTVNPIHLPDESVTIKSAIGAQVDLLAEARSLLSGIAAGDWRYSDTIGDSHNVTNELGWDIASCYSGGVEDKEAADAVAAKTASFVAASPRLVARLVHELESLENRLGDFVNLR